MSQYLGELILKISGDNKQLNDSIKKSKKSSEDFRKQLDKIGGGIEKFGKNMTKFVTLPVLAMGAGIVKAMADTDKEFAKKLDGIAKDAQGLAVSFGQALMPAINEVIKVLRDAIKWFTDLDAGTKKTIVTIAALGAAIGPVMMILGNALKFIAANPTAAVLIAIAAGVIAVTTAINAMKDADVEARLAVEGLSKASQEASMAMAKSFMTAQQRDFFISNYKEITKNFQGMTKSVQDFGNEMAKQSKEALLKSLNLTEEQANKIMSDWKKERLSDRQKEIAETIEKYEIISRAAKAAGKENKETEKNVERQKNTDLAAINKKYDDEENKRLKDQSDSAIKIALDKATKVAKIEEEKIKNIEGANKKAANKVAKAAKDKAKKDVDDLEKAKEQAIAGGFAITQALVDFGIQQNNNKISQLDSQISINEQALQVLKDQQQKFLDEGNVAQANAINADIAAKQAQIDADKNAKRQLLESNKQAAIFSALIAGVQAVAQSFANGGGWPWGLIPAGIMAALSAVQVASIASQPIPALGDGGLVMPKAGGTGVIMAEAGVPEFAVPDRTDVMLRIADRISSNMDRPNVTNNNNTQMPGSLNIDGKEFRVWMEKQFVDGRIRVAKRAVR